MQVPSPQARPTVSGYLGDSAPKPAYLIGAPGHSDMPQSLRTIKAVGPQNTPILVFLELGEIRLPRGEEPEVGWRFGMDIQGHLGEGMEAKPQKQENTRCWQKQ